MMDFIGKPAQLKDRIAQLRAAPSFSPDVSIVIPVNAQKDLAPLHRVLSDLTRYPGSRRLEIILVINNYPAEEPPDTIRDYEQAGCLVISIPRIVHHGGIAMAARIPGVKRASSQNVILFDADVRIPNPGVLIDWYADRLQEGYDLAYTHVDYTDLPPGISVKARMFVHHASRWIKRNLLRNPNQPGQQLCHPPELDARPVQPGTHSL